MTLTADFIPEEVIQNSSALVMSTFLLRDESSPIFNAAIRAIDLSNKHNVPVILSLGTSSLIDSNRSFFQDLIKNKINILAGNLEEYHSLFDQDMEKDPSKLESKCSNTQTFA